ncbi:cellulose biosynthesis protein BcsR [Candidatus Pantoea rara]|uniref:cellulose biosynthesis protein BcsR n=1 Tax=Candidatus Pantoea rara TaxID=1947037 RepID=UPI003EBB1861
MKNQNLHIPEADDGDRQDDISALRDAFSLHAFRYVDIAREERLKEIVSRWPLIAETVPTQPEQSH